MIDDSKEYIICAAIWYDDGIAEDEKLKDEITFPMHGKGRTFANDNISTGFVIGGFRHGNRISIRPTNPKFKPVGDSASTSWETVGQVGSLNQEAPSFMEE